MSEVENCFRCGQTPDDILMLSCNHDLCLLCAAQVYVQQSKYYNQSKPDAIRKSNLVLQCINCEICQSFTELDASSIAELQKINLMILEDQKIPKNTTKNTKPKPNKRTIEPQVKQVEKENNPSVNRSFSTKEMPLKNLCQEHPEEDLYYYCFTCLCQCICPECVIHGKHPIAYNIHLFFLFLFLQGKHKDHDVKTIRKSYPVVKGLLEDIATNTIHLSHQIQEYRDEIDKRVTQHSTTMTKFKYSIQSEFEVLHQVLVSQEKLVIESLTSIPTLSFDTFLNQCKQVEQQCITTINSVSKQLQNKDEVRLLNYYSDVAKIPHPKLDSLPAHEESQINQQDWLISIRKTVDTIKNEIKGLTMNRLLVWKVQ